MDKKERERGKFTGLPGDLTERGREIWLAGLGAFSAVEEEGSKVFNNLVKRGEDMEKEGKEQFEEAYAELDEQQREAQKQAGKAASGMENVFSNAMAMAMERLGVPTRSEVNRLSDEVERLSNKVDALTAAMDKQGTTGTTTPHVMSTYHIRPESEGEWSITKEGAAKALTTYESKKEALDKGRKLAEKHEPSRLIVHRQDGSVQETFAYGDEV